MKKKNKQIRIASAIIAVLLIISMISGTVITAFADQSKIVTLGVDLSEEQRQLILDYFNVDENQVVLIEVNNKEEHEYLDGIASQQQIGSHTYSCTYIEPTNEGGIHIKTVNLNWVTCEMIRNALITSGITNCNIICASPIEVSGTGALTGIFKAYSTETEDKLEEEKIELASTELIQTMDIAETVGQEEATEIVGEIKERVITDGLESTEEVTEEVISVLSNYEVELTKEQEDALIQLMLDIAQQDYSVEDIRNAYTAVKDTVDTVIEKSEETKGFLEKISNWFSTTWQKITGTYEEVKASEEAQKIKNQLGILADTNDSLLGDNTVVTVTEDQETIDKAEKADEYKEDTENKEDESFLDKIVSFFKNLFGGNKEDNTSGIEDKTSNEKEEDKTSEEDVKITFESTSESTSESVENNKILDEVTYEMQNGDSEESNNTLDDLVK